MKVKKDSIQIDLNKYYDSPLLEPFSTQTFFLIPPPPELRIMPQGSGGVPPTIFNSVLIRFQCQKKEMFTFIEQFLNLK